MRHVTDNERAFIESYFGESVDTRRVRVGFSPSSRSWSPLGNMVCLTRKLFVGASAKNEVDLVNPHAAAVFAHEVIHVWQRQRGVWVSRKGAYLQTLYTLGLHDPYAYDTSLTCSKDLLTCFVLGNLEQQGRIFQDYVFASRRGMSVARFCDVARWVRESRRAT